MTALGLLPGLVAVALGSGAQLAGSDGLQSLAPPDSEAVLSSLRSAQRRFEWVRRRHLPRVLGTSGGRCDVVVGRYCYWDDDDEVAWTPEPEHDRIVLERQRLLDRLDSSAAIFPRDPWIAAQRTRYLIETARYQDALWAVRGCSAAGWWCHLLTGFVLHNMGAYSSADSAFDLAVQTMPEEQRCHWTDMSVLLDGKGTEEYRDRSCSIRDSVNSWIWWLADPLYLVPGNERRTEHYARLALDWMLDGTAIVYGTRWGKDNRELMVRYGWSIGWEREPSRGIERRPRIVGHHADGGMRFVPPFHYVTDPATVARGKWELDPRVPRSRAAMRYATEFRALEHQLAVFRRGDTAVVVIGYDLGKRSSATHRREPGRADPVQAGLFLTTDPTVTYEVRHLSETGTGGLALRVPPAPMLLSVEALDPRDSLAARSRYWVDLTATRSEGFAVSDILLLARGPAQPTSLEEAIPRARGTAQFEPGEPIEMYWEIYGAPADTAHEVSISVTKLGGGFFRSAVEWIGLAGERRPETFRWEGPRGGQTDGFGRAIGIQLADGNEGRYLLRLEIRTSAGSVAVTEREIDIKKR